MDLKDGCCDSDHDGDNHCLPPVFSIALNLESGDHDVLDTGGSETLGRGELLTVQVREHLVSQYGGHLGWVKVVGDVIERATLQDQLSEEILVERALVRHSILEEGEPLETGETRWREALHSAQETTDDQDEQLPHLVDPADSPNRVTRPGSPPKY